MKLKKTVREILTEKVISVSSKTPVSEAVSIMEANNISCLVATEGKKPVGILTERDIVMSLCQEVNLEECTVDDLMSKPVLTAKEDIDIYEAHDLLTEKRIRHIIITNSHDEIKGVVTQTDIMNNLALEYFIEIKSIEKLMTKNVITFKKEDQVKDAVTQMGKHNISCIVIEENHHPIGILTERDVTRKFHNGRDIATLKIEEAMSHPVKTIALDTPVYDAAKIMKKQNIRRLVVVDNEDKIIGLLTQSDIIKGLEGKYIESLKEIIKIKEEILKETKKDLDEKTVYLDNILRSSTDMAIVATDLDFHISYFNPVAEKFYGYKPDEVIGKKLDKIHRKEKVDTKQFKKAIKIVKEEGEHTYIYKRKNHKGDRYIESRVSGIWDSDQNLVGFVLMSRDITGRKIAETALQKAHKDLEKRVEERTAELKKAYEKLKAVDELKTNIIANVSHELRTPISIANSALELTFEEKQPEERDKLLKIALNALTRQDAIIGNLLAAVKIKENKNKKTKSKTVNIAKTINQECTEFKPQAAGKKIKINVQIEKDLPHVKIGYEQLRRILHNLIHNAIKFNKKEGEVTVIAKRKKDTVEVCVNDTGIGIPKDKQDKIFDRFYQVDSSTIRPYGGTGMGLAIVKEILEAYDGTINIESETDKGSSFCITLPTIKEETK